jgi:hypothetical protein
MCARQFAGCDAVGAATWPLLAARLVVPRELLKRTLALTANAHRGGDVEIPITVLLPLSTRPCTGVRATLAWLRPTGACLGAKTVPAAQSLSEYECFTKGGGPYFPIRRFVLIMPVTNTHDSKGPRSHGTRPGARAAATRRLGTQA